MYFIGREISIEFYFVIIYFTVNYQNPWTLYLVLFTFHFQFQILIVLKIYYPCYRE